MEIVYLILIMLVLGLIVGWIGGLIWKENRPYGPTGDYLAAVASTIVIGLIDWFVIPAMGFSNTMRYLGVALEPWIGAFLVLWLLRLAKK